MAETKLKGGSFRTMNLDQRLLRNIPYDTPTPIQRKTLPLALEKRSLFGVGRTGSGKTLCYLIPAIERALSGERTFILVPTKELVLQVRRVMFELCRGIDLNGMIEVGTPGGAGEELDVDMLVVDEVDRILEEPGLRKVFDRLNESLSCQKLFFSATLPDIPLSIRVVRIESKINEAVRHVFLYVPTESKDAALLSILDGNRKTIIFVATRYAVDLLLEILGRYGYEAHGIYSSMDEDARERNFKRFNTDRVRILVVTDVAARGLDIPLLDTVINYDLCDERTFLHRVGRVRGMGMQYSLVNYSEVFQFFNIQETYLPGVEIGTFPQNVLDRYDLGEFGGLRARANNGYQKCLKFRRKVSVPEDYKDRIGEFKVHSMFSVRETLLDKLREMRSRSRPPRKGGEEKENRYRDQLFIPYRRTESRTHSSAFGVYKDDYVTERRERHESRMARKRQVQ
jgi:ATP-dependent RNA helicase DDX54/DBP10